MRRLAAVAAIATLWFGVGCGDGDGGADAPAAHPSTEGMVLVRGGTFVMGSDAPAAEAAERPAHRVRVDDFWMDVHEVTNAEFDLFVRRTGYVTVAERVPVLEELMAQLPPGSPEPPAASLVPGAAVFRMPERAVPLDDPGGWWVWTPGASWRCPSDTTIGIVAAGYGDGFPRHARSGTPTLVNGKRATIIGTKPIWRSSSCGFDCY